MALIDHIREARAKMTSGALSEEEAAQHLVTASGEGLTHQGALNLISQPVTDTEEKYTKVFDRAAEGLRKYGSA